MSKPDAKHSQYESALVRWGRCRAATAGQEAIHKAGAAYLPKLAEQTREEYEAFKSRALYYNATGRTVDGLTGLIFRRPPAMELPEALTDLLDDVDTSGTPLGTFCETVVEELTVVGRFGLLADYPRVVGMKTQAEERSANIRPFVQLYTAESIINWRVSRIRNSNQLSLVTLLEVHTVEGDYDTTTVPQLRILRLIEGRYTVEIWRKNTAEVGEAWLLIDSFEPTINGKPIDYIPFLICGPRGIDSEVRKPPILDLVDVNVSHYRTTADYEHGLHFTGLPTPVVYGHTFDPGEKFALGSTVAKAFASPDAKAEFLEFKGEGLRQLADRLKQKEAMMAALGARMLAPEKRAAEAAETAEIHRSGENSVLASLAIAASWAITKALQWAGAFVSATGDTKVELNTDYLPAGMTAQELSELVKAWQAGAISYETLYDNLLRGEIARQGVTAEQERAKIDEEGPALGTLNNGNGE